MAFDYLIVIYVIILYFVEWAYNFQIFIKYFVFKDCGQCWRVMLLVICNYMGDQRAFTWQKARTCLESLCMPHLWKLLLSLLLFLGFLFRPWWHFRFIRWIIIQESQLSTNTKIRYSEQNNLFKHGIPAELMRVIYMQIHFLSTQRLQMHDIANIQIENPIILILGN